MTAKTAISTTLAMMTAASFVAVAPVLGGKAAHAGAPDIQLTSVDYGFLGPLYAATDNTGVTDLMQEINKGLEALPPLSTFTNESGTVNWGLANIVDSQYNTLMPSGFLSDSTSALGYYGDGGSNQFLGDIPGDPSNVGGPDVGSWVTNLANAIGQGSDPAFVDNLNGVAGLLPNGVNYLFDQLAADGMDIVHLMDPSAPFASFVINPDALFGLLQNPQVDELFGLLISSPGTMEVMEPLAPLLVTGIDLLGVF